MRRGGGALACYYIYLFAGLFIAVSGLFHTIGTVFFGLFFGAIGLVAVIIKRIHIRTGKNFIGFLCVLGDVVIIIGMICMMFTASDLAFRIPFGFAMVLSCLSLSLNLKHLDERVKSGGGALAYYCVCSFLGFVLAICSYLVGVNGYNYGIMIMGLLYGVGGLVAVILKRIHMRTGNGFFGFFCVLIDVAVIVAILYAMYINNGFDNIENIYIVAPLIVLSYLSLKSNIRSLKRKKANEDFL